MPRNDDKYPPYPREPYYWPQSQEQIRAMIAQLLGEQLGTILTDDSGNFIRDDAGNFIYVG